VWGVPEYDSRKLFEKLNLDGAQAGLSWYTILVRTERYRRAFDGWDPERIARYDERKVAALLQDPGIIRNRLKVEAAIHNARAYLALEEQEGSFSDFLWRYVDGSPIVNHWTAMEQVPAQTPRSQQLSKDLKKRGFRFVGPTIVYAFMQAVGMVDDHLSYCWRRQG
jgi:DNA-3-methyladenine glycosylase I